MKPVHLYRFILESRLTKDKTRSWRKTTWILWGTQGTLGRAARFVSKHWFSMFFSMISADFFSCEPSESWFSFQQTFDFWSRKDAYGVFSLWTLKSFVQNFYRCLSFSRKNLFTGQINLFTQYWRYLLQSEFIIIEINWNFKFLSERIPVSGYIRTFIPPCFRQQPK